MQCYCLQSNLISITNTIWKKNTPAMGWLFIYTNELICNSLKMTMISNNPHYSSGICSESFLIRLFVGAFFPYFLWGAKTPSENCRSIKMAQLIFWTSLSWEYDIISTLPKRPYWKCFETSLIRFHQQQWHRFGFYPISIQCKSYCRWTAEISSWRLNRRLQISLHVLISPTLIYITKLPK